jgi:hypothetical protein
VTQLGVRGYENFFQIAFCFLRTDRVFLLLFPRSTMTTTRMNSETGIVPLASTSQTERLKVKVLIRK